ncbi:MAG: hypothetical protein ACOCQM_00800 [Natronomonas sp.]
MRPNSTRVVLLTAVLCLAAVAFVGVGAAAEDPTEGTTIDVDIAVDADGEGGDASVVCTGAVTDHDCDKGGELDAGPASVEYDGFNDDSLEERSSAFGDTFVVTVGNESVTVGFTCEVGLEPSAENPCPVDVSEGDTTEDDDVHPSENGEGDENDTPPEHANGQP